MLTLTQGAFTFDLSRYIEGWEPSIEPSFNYHTLKNGNIIKKSDLGNTSDKFYSSINLVLDFTSYQSLISFYDSTKNSGYVLSTDLDLFFPGVINTSCIISEFNTIGYFGDIFTRAMEVELRLLLTETMIYPYTPTLPSIFNRGIWTPDYNYTTSFNVSLKGNTPWKVNFNNDVSKWTVDFDFLKIADAKILLSWILSTRSNRIQIQTNDINGNLKGNKNNPVQMARLSPYNIESFSFERVNLHYTLSIVLVDASSR